MYNSLKNYSTDDYNRFVKQSLERLTAHFGNYGSGGGYNLKPTKRNTDYDLF